MIKFFPDSGGVIDLSNQKLTLVEESDFFGQNIVRNYSYPFSFYLNGTLSEKLGLLNYENIVEYQTKITGNLLIESLIYDAYILITEIVGERIEAQLQYGPETLPVYSKKLKDLPWPTIVVADLIDHAQSQINKGWPEVGYNFPMLYRPDIKERDFYEAYKYFLNHHDGTAFLRNYRNDIEFGETSIIFVVAEDFVQPYTLPVTINSESPYTIETDQPWLSTNANSGQFLTNLNVTVDFSSLVPFAPTDDAEYRLHYGNVIVKTDNFERRLNVGLQINAEWAGNIQWSGEFPDEEEEEIVFNQNVMVPCIYMAEIIRFGFAQEGLSLLGDLVNSVFETKKMIVPDNFMERFSSDTYEAWSFDFKTGEIPFGTGTVNVYKEVLQPQKVGTYNLTIKVNLSSAQAQNFVLTVKLKELGSENRQTIYSASGFEKQINIDEKVTFNITTENQFDDLEIEMLLTPTDEDISPLNSFVYELKEGRLNVFPNSFSLADYMPDMTFAEFMNIVQDFSKVDIEPKENIVFLERLDSKLENLTFVDHSHIQAVLPRKRPNFNKVYQYSLLDGQVLWADKTGIIYNIDDVPDNDLVKNPIKVYPLLVEENYNVITANFVEDSQQLRMVLYDGPVDGRPVCVESIDGIRLRLEDIYENFLKVWTTFRTSSESYKDKVKVKLGEVFNYRIGVFKYNKKHLLKKITKTNQSEGQWLVETESETL